MKLAKLLAILTTAFVLAACGEPETSADKAKDAVKDALDTRPAENLQDAGEELQEAAEKAADKTAKAVEDAVKAVEETVETVKQETQDAINKAME
jgi:gas vesicle protein